MLAHGGGEKGRVEQSMKEAQEQGLCGWVGGYACFPQKLAPGGSQNGATGGGKG